MRHVLHAPRQGHVPRQKKKKKKETAVKQSQPIKVIHPTLRHRARRGSIPLTNLLTAGAALLVIVLSVSLSSAANTKAETCVMPLAGPAPAHCE